MIYKFKSKASGDVIMLQRSGDRMLRLIGREPAAQGIIKVEHMAAAISALRAALVADEASAKGGKGAQGAQGAQGDAADPGDDDEAQGRGSVTLRQRLWPVIDLLERSLAAREPVVWGV